MSAALVLATLVVYAPVFRFPFVNFDDPDYVARNRFVQAGLSGQGVRWAFETFTCANWHPLTWISLQLDATLFGGNNSAGYHLTNVLFHAANGVLLFLVLESMTGTMGRSAVVAGLFALHPLHVESVAWIAERKDVLSTLFWMLTMAAYCAYARRPGITRYVVVMLCLGLGLLAKPMLVTLPFVLLLLDFWPLCRWRGAVPPSPPSPRGGGKVQHRQERDASPPQFPSMGSSKIWIRLVLEKVPLLVLVVASCFMTVLAQREGNAIVPMYAASMSDRVGNALYSYVAYLGQTVWPVGLAAYYPHPHDELAFWQAALAGLLLLATTVFAVVARQRWPYFPVGWFWYLGTLTPVIGLVQVGGQAMADRYTYIPLVGIFILGVWGLGDLLETRRVPVYAVGSFATVLLAACGLGSWIQVGYWQDDVHLWKHAIDVTSNNEVAHTNLGVAYVKQKEYARAQKEYEAALKINSNYVIAQNNLGSVLRLQGHADRAVAEHEKAIGLDRSNADAHLGLGVALLDLGRRPEAGRAFRDALALDSTLAPAHLGLGVVLLDQGLPAQAMGEYAKTLEIDPKRAEAHLGMGFAHRHLGNWEESMKELQIALDQKPELTQAQVAIVELLLERGLYLQAEDRIRNLLAVLSPNDPQRAIVSGQQDRCQRLRAQDQKGSPSKSERREGRHE